MQLSILYLRIKKSIKLQEVIIMKLKHLSVSALLAVSLLTVPVCATTVRAAETNDTSRYYYNLDLMSSSDNAQNIMLWSVKKYAYSDIAGEFSTTLANTLSGDADMTGLSFYPVALADGITIGDLTISQSVASYGTLSLTSELIFRCSSR